MDLLWICNGNALLMIFYHGNASEIKKKDIISGRELMLSLLTEEDHCLYYVNVRLMILCEECLGIKKGANISDLEIMPALLRE